MEDQMDYKHIPGVGASKRGSCGEWWWHRVQALVSRKYYPRNGCLYTLCSHPPTKICVSQDCEIPNQSAPYAD